MKQIKLSIVGAHGLPAKYGGYCTLAEYLAEYKPEDFDVTVRNVKISAGAGFIVVLTGDIMTMPGLPKVPSAEKIDVDENGVITGLF